MDANWLIGNSAGDTRAGGKTEPGAPAWPRIAPTPTPEWIDVHHPRWRGGFGPRPRRPKPENTGTPDM